ncbi:MAG: Lrp/AsnC family leucine-responsive transcriptional regulator [Oceanospirillaceae bacterium]|jgi:Lrp/AsnC family leucine-responsive transcriptional regulator
MDNLDYKILQRLQVNCRQSTEELGAKVGLSATACQRRIKKLRQQGVIASEVAIVNPQQVANYLTVLIDVKLVKGGVQIVDKFKQEMQSCESVQQCYYLAGEVDFSLIVSVKSMQHYEALTRDLLLNNADVHTFLSKFSMDNVKTSWKIPLA